MTEPVTARERLEASMVDECRITVPDPGPGVLDEDTGVVTPRAPTLIYEGPCMVGAPRRVARATMRGGETEYVQEYPVSLPYDAPTIPIGAVVKMTAVEADPDLVDAELAVHTAIVGSRVARRRLFCDLTKVGPR